MNEAALFPTVNNLLSGGTGRMLPEDLDFVDRCVDSYTNGRIYDADIDAEWIHAHAVETRLRRADDYYTRVLHSLSQVRVDLICFDLN